MWALAFRHLVPSGPEDPGSFAHHSEEQGLLLGPHEQPPEAARRVPRAVTARRPNHVWMSDLTDVKGLFRLVTFKVAVVFDVFSRMPLSLRVFVKEPSASDMAAFVSRSARHHGRPAHFVSDRGQCFRGRFFLAVLRRLGIARRFGAVGRKGSIALIERL